MSNFRPEYKKLKIKIRKHDSNQLKGLKKLIKYSKIKSSIGLYDLLGSYQLYRHIYVAVCSEKSTTVNSYDLAEFVDKYCKWYTITNKRILKILFDDIYPIQLVTTLIKENK